MMKIGAILKLATWPFKKISREVGEEIAEKAQLAARAALAEAPLLDDLLDGKEVTLEAVVSVILRLKPSA